MARKRKLVEAPPADLPMTPMIDVVFQLLIYFLVTIKPVDVFAKLDVFRPSPEAAKPQSEMPKVLQLTVQPGGNYELNGMPLNRKGLDTNLGMIASIDKTQTLLIKCSHMSQHQDLIEALNLCAKYQLNNLSVVSMN